MSPLITHLNRRTLFHSENLLYEKPLIMHSKRPPFYKRPKLFVFLLIPLAFFSIISNYSHLHLPRDRCYHISGKNKEQNPHSRTLCVMQNVCVGNSTLWIQENRRTVCKRVTPQWRDTGDVITNCNQFRRDYIECAHGKGLKTGYPTCPQGKGIQSGWLNGLAVIVPEYPWPRNLYHYGNSITTVIHAVRGLNETGMGGRRVEVVFTGERNERMWHSGFVNALFGKLEKELDIGVRYGAGGCWKEAVVLGLRGSHNVWPFANVSDVDLMGKEIGKEAVWVKDAVYRAVGAGGVFQNEKMALGKRVLGYAKRVGRGHNSGRVFGKEDEIWMENMLSEECRRTNVTLEVWETLGSFEEQVKRAERAGVVVGIHGAKLVNSWFVRPFGGLVEIIPKNVNSTCYVGGSNSGLRYWRWESTEYGHGEECKPEDDDKTCRGLNRARGVGIGGKGEKERLRGMVREALEYLKGMHENVEGSGGIQVRYDELKEVYFRD